jgi:hypothetical protein
MASQFDQAEALALAEHRAVETLAELSVGCGHRRVLAGSTKRGPAFVYFCAHCRHLTVISVPAGGLRNRDPGDPTSRTRLSTFALGDVLVETGAFIESDGTTRARFVIHLPGNPEPEWDLTSDAAAVGAAVEALRGTPETRTR